MNPDTGFFKMTIINLNDQESNLNLTNYDVIIIGSGPAGICAAVELSNSKKRIAVLEA
jgi:ribulose 1,5-bisphosphate synthetase/thiazole synthase